MHRALPTRSSNGQTWLGPRALQSCAAHGTASKVRWTGLACVKNATLPDRTQLLALNLSPLSAAPAPQAAVAEHHGRPVHSCYILLKQAVHSTAARPLRGSSVKGQALSAMGCAGTCMAWLTPSLHIAQVCKVSTVLPCLPPRVRRVVCGAWHRDPPLEALSLRILHVVQAHRHLLHVGGQTQDGPGRWRHQVPSLGGSLLICVHAAVSAVRERVAGSLAARRALRCGSGKRAAKAGVEVSTGRQHARGPPGPVAASSSRCLTAFSSSAHWLCQLLVQCCPLPAMGQSPDRAARPCALHRAARFACRASCMFHSSQLIASLLRCAGQETKR